ncbi:MAG: hypothetical protein V4772_23050 [Pseudomonadota bacterium]
MNNFLSKVFSLLYPAQAQGRLQHQTTKQAMPTRVPHQANAPGDFYVEDGCCTSCNMPFTVAPDLFASDPDGHCYVSKQPADPGEVYRMVQAFSVQEVGCIRYKGKNRVIKIQLIATGEGNQCDSLDADLKSLHQEVKADRWGLGG